MWFCPFTEFILCVCIHFQFPFDCNEMDVLQEREKKSPDDRGIIRDKAAAKQTRHGLAAWCPAYFYFLSPSDFLKEVYKKFGRELAYLGRLFQAVLESSSITKSDKVGYFSSSQLNVCIYHGIIQYILAQLFKWKVLYVVEFNGAVERSCFGAYGHIPLSTSNKMTCKVTKRKVFFFSQTQRKQWQTKTVLHTWK